MLYHWRCALLLFGLVALLSSQTSAFAETALMTPAISTQSSTSSLLQLARKDVIDKSCIMMCDKWGEHDCLKWVMRCKGDPGYPKALSKAP